MALGRIGVIGDIHAEHERLATALALLRSRNLDALVSTGDIVDGPGSVDTCCDLLRANDVVTVAGNHDRWLLADSLRTLPNATTLAELSQPSLAFLSALPRTVGLETVKGPAILCHGIGRNDMVKVNPTDQGYALETNDDLQRFLRNGFFRWMINGHSHRRMVRPFPGLTIINAGTLKRGHEPCVLEVDFVAAAVHVFEFAEDGSLGQSPSTLELA